MLYLSAYKDRRLKKRQFRNLWIVRLNAFLQDHQLNYSTFMGRCKKKDVALNRKVLSELAYHKPEVVSDLIKFIK